MVTNDQRDKLGRYERGLSFANFALLGDGIVRLSWGIAGFGEQGSREISATDMDTDVRELLADGYQKTDEVPVAEGTCKGGDALLDWVGGITR
jgi:hypothetical protein